MPHRVKVGQALAWSWGLLFILASSAQPQDSGY